MTRMRKYLPPVFGAAVAVGLFLGLQLVSYMRFENSDDILIVKSFMGFEGGVPARFNLYLHTLTARLLGWISTLRPNVPWFSLLQLFCLGLAVAVLAKCVLECGTMEQKAFSWPAAALALLLSGVICAFACARINFTTTAALLGAAAVAELLTLLSPARHSPGRAAVSVLLLLGCYLIRPQSFVAALPFWGLALLWLLYVRGVPRRGPTGRAKPTRFPKKGALRLAAGAAPLPRSFFATLLAGTLLLGVLAGVRFWELQDPLLKELDEFQTANLGPMDYDESMLEAVPDSVLADIGWSRAELTLVRQWYFMDQNITAQAFRRLSEAMAQPVAFPVRVAGAVQAVAGFYQSNARYLSAAVWLLALCALCFALPAPCALFAAPGPLSPLSFSTGGSSLGRDGCEKRKLLTPLAALFCVLGTAALLLYLAYGGRFLARAADCALFPAAALLCCLCAHCLGSFRGVERPRRIAALLLCAVMLGAGAVNLLETRKVLNDRPDTVSATRESDLEAFALAHPEQLILRTPDLLRDTRLWPDVSAGTPGNIMIWGDWYCRTPSWYGQLERYGFDGRHFTAADFLRDNLLFATAEAAPPEALLTYLAQGTKSAVQAELYGVQGELRFFRFLPGAA